MHLPNPAEYGSLLSPLPGRFLASYRPSLRSPSRPATGTIPDPYEANLAESLHFSKEILMVSVR